MTTRLRYVALGDSYTIGTGVGSAERFPDQLVVALDDTTPGLRLVANLGVDGYTSADLIRDQLPAVVGLRPGLVSVLIGVNDVVQRVPADRYAANVAYILDTLTRLMPPGRIVAATIPDYTVTPAGADYGDPAVARAGIRDHNLTMTRLAGERGISVVDIHDLSLAAATDRTLVADDGLHPSGRQYARWVERIAPVVRDLVAG